MFMIGSVGQVMTHDFRSELVIKYPVDFGLVNNWEDMEKAPNLPPFW